MIMNYVVLSIPATILEISGEESNGTETFRNKISEFGYTSGAFHSTKTFENLETAANGTGISWKSFRKLLNFRSANHSTENFRNSGSKVEWKFF